jgi:hypothetical protein
MSPMTVSRQGPASSTDQTITVDLTFVSGQRPAFYSVSWQLKAFEPKAAGHLAANLHFQSVSADGGHSPMAVGVVGVPTRANSGAAAVQVLALAKQTMFQRALRLLRLITHNNVGPLAFPPA